MKIHSYFLLLIILLYSCSVEESTKPTQSDYYPLSSLQTFLIKVNAFAEDAQGHIWIGTFRGLNKYNAHE